MKGAKMSFANLSCANLNNSFLKNSTFVDTNFRGANLQYASLIASQSKGADFTGANLEGADLSYTVLIEAKFRNAYIPNTKFKESIIYNAKFLGKPIKWENKSIDELIKEESTLPVAFMNFQDARTGENLSDFEGAIVDYDNYSKLSFLKNNYTYKELNESDILKSGYVYAVKNYLINELKKGNKVGKLIKK